MLPRIISSKGVALGLLVLCVSSEIVTAGSLRSNILAKKLEKPAENSETTDCFSCDSIKACALRQYEQRKCPIIHGESACMTVYNAAGLVKQRGCSATLSKSLSDYCAENPGKCLTCDGDSCNDQANLVLPRQAIETFDTKDSTYKCYHCEDDCEDVDVVTCSSAVDNDKRCYMRFKEPEGVVGMGCITDFPNEQDLITLIKEKALYICDGDMCNGFEHIPTPNDCSSCRSDSTESCATLPTLISATVNCALPPYTHCYQRVDKTTNGVTERGCLSSLSSDDFWKCLTANDGSDCKICIGNACNREIIPVSRPRCHRCDSSTNAKCEESPDSLSICPVYNAVETCVATYDAGITKRGCSSDLECDPRSRTCQTCNGSGCNIANLKKRAEEIYGIFQDLPLNCYTCEGKDCDTGMGVVRKCENDPYQDCLTVFNEQGKVVRRGCELAVREEYEMHCETHPELCFNCKSNGCNTMTDASKYHECLYCDSAINPDCLFKPETVTGKRKCVEGCVASLYNRKTNPNVQDFVRTCFEDIEEDDRDTCTAANNCIQCEDKDNCNTDVLPDNRLSCLHCNGPDCNAPQSSICAGYSSEDQCYMYFDNTTYSVVRMGCVSDLMQYQVEKDIKHYFLCDGDDCNNYENIPEANRCLVCNSADNEDCAVNPTKIKNNPRCQAYPYTQCYMRINGDGHTERGCFYNLATEDFIKCKNGDPSEICKLCTESDCNNAIYPTRRQQCHRCNSLTDANCESSPANPQVCAIYKEEDGCVTKLVKGVTYRGCLSEMTCEGSDRKSCSSCKGPNCNVVDLSATSIGDPGLFQALPLNCYHCEGKDDCAGSSLGVIRKCESNILQTCTVTFDSSGDVVARGCSDALDTICEESGNMCYDCKSNGCNEALHETDYIDCVFCDAQEGEKCVFDVKAVTRRRKCHKACMTALYPRTSDPEPVYELIRTCLDDMDLDDREECEAGKSDKCITCTGSDCNTKDLGERKSCYHCEGSDCQLPQMKTCRATTTHDQCFIEYDEAGGVVELGCKSKYDPQDVITLLSAKRLWLCDEDNCNDIEHVPAAQQCIICSSRTDKNCATAPTELNTSTTCSRQPYTECYMRVLEDGHTERGCLSSLENDNFLNCLNGENMHACMKCTGNSCNNKLFPTERRSCHICSSDSSSTCEKTPSSAEICLKYTPDEHCVTLIDENGETVRGCSSQLTCDASDSANCRLCDSDDCNRFNLKRKADGKPGMWQELPLKCHVCDSVADCAASTKESVCGDHEYCMTVFDQSGAVEARGCSVSIESKFGDYCDENSAHCHNCNSNNCNTATSTSDYVDCVYCDSESNPNCVFQPELVGNRRMCNGACMTAVYPKPNSTVYALTRSCLDDKDEAERKVCQEGDELCAACSDGAACNTALVPENRWSCHVCVDEDCEDSEPQLCKYYKKDERCFMLFSGDNSIIRKGCVSDLDESYLADNIDSLYLCSSGSNCNSFENMPTPKRCVECDSIDDPDCASYPENVPFIATCTTFPNTQCFTRVYRDGSTKRGCVSKLTKSERLSCLSGESTDCKACNEDNCNKEIYPADRRRCHRCNSIDDPKCENAPSSASVCPFYSKEEFCSTKLVNGDTYRGCSSDFQCDATNYEYCRLCRGNDNCNAVDLKSLSIGQPGKWQTLPLNCFTCKGDECKTGQGTLRKCENNKQQNCGTIFAEDGSVIQRGCSNQIYESTDAQNMLEYCDNHPENCKFCKSNGCNTATSLDEFVDCIFCDGTENADCVLNVGNIKHRRSCHKKCLTGLYPRKDEKNPAYELTRGCLDDMDLDDQEVCENGDNPLCKACEGANCNAVALPESPRLKCQVCHGNDCSSPQSHHCLAYREHDQCFAMFNHDDEGNTELVRMGCASDLDNSDLVAERRSLFLCNGDDCNDKSNFPAFTGCSVCNSNNWVECATDPKIPVLSTACDILPFTQCYTSVDENGLTHRGCLSDVIDDVFDECISGESGKCQICDQNQCNTEIFPENRRSCHRCDSTKNPSCEDSPQAFASICPLYSDDDSCVTKIEGSRTLRGCATDFTCDPSDSKTCRLCKSDNCNSINLLSGYIGEPGKWQDLPLNCHHCEGEDCSFGDVLVQKCEGNNLQTCMTVFGADGLVQSRGCSDLVEKTHASYCETNPDKCFACKSNGCNDAKSLDEYTDCFFCDSAEGKHCSVNFDTTTRTRKCHGGCMAALYPRNSAESPVYEMSRSCLDDMDLDDREKCEAGEREFCKACTGPRCNDMAVPEVRHECFRCTEEDCEDIETQECNAYHPHDQCYILYDNQSSIAGMGCRSDFEIDVVTDLIRQKRLILCDGKNCNSPDIVKTKSCLVCDSADDPRCATNPNLIDGFETCRGLPYTDCFTRVNEVGQTVRGCLSSLPSEVFYGCLMNEDGLCEKCTTDNCNSIDIFPTNRLRCHQCDSNSNGDCEAAPNSNRVCPVYDAEDVCVTNLRNGITYRSCASSLKCSDETDKRNCRTCKTSGCNTVDLARVSPDGEPGKWQDVPLTCLHCSDESDCESGAIFRVCQENLYQSCMTVFNVAGKVVESGCSDAVEANNVEHCEANPSMCLRCNSNGCNVATSLDDYVECWACDTDTNGNCVTNLAELTKTRKCYKHCMTAMYPREHEENPAYHLARSCLDDMDLDDQEACLAGEKEYCKACDGAKCNTVDIPAERLSCNKCKGDSCQLPIPEICSAYQEGDQCYVLFDETREVSAMGCRSEFSNVEADFLLRQKRLFLCTDDNCNDVDSLPKEQTCTICSSRTDISCAIHPETLDTNVVCNNVPFTECYSRVLEDGSTERGCLSSLYDDQFVGCLSGNSSLCHTCKGDTCNTAVFPADRARCHICDSSFDPQCESRPDNLDICPLYDAEDTCVTAYRSGVTLRGCSSSLKCDGGSKNCAKCKGDGCNTIDLAKRQDDNYGKWQDLPLRCHVCSGDECKDQSRASVETCQNNNEQDCMVVFDENGEVIERGCEDAIEESHGSYCDEHGDHCFSCKSNECNVAVSMDEFDECVYCDTHKDLSCLWEPESASHRTRKCRGGCMTALYPSDASSNPAYDLIRTCLDDKEKSDQTSCTKGTSTCKACTEGNCNTDDLPDNRLSCLYCDNGDCEEPVPRKCPLYKKDDQCFIWFDSSNSASEMGCVSSFRNQELESIIKTKRVYICDDSENCNDLNRLNRTQKCASCNSKDDVLCAVNAKAVGTFGECNMMPYTNCYSKLNSDGTTSRGCLAELAEDVFAACLLGKDENCGICSGDGCNREVYPADRQQCHTCTSLDDADCESFPTHMQPCPLVNDNESCKTGLSGNETIRGCSSEILCDVNDSKTCRSCFGTACNSIDLFNKIDDGYHGAWQNLPLTCHECIGDHCQASLGPTVKCANNIEQDCMTVFGEDGSIRRRGCSDAVEDYEDLYCRKHPHLCFKCKSNDCNYAWSTDEYVDCTFCNSTQNQDCAIKPDSTSFATRKCYKECMVTLGDDHEVIRSCLDDKEVFNQVDCRADSEECVSCSDGNCNNFIYPHDRLMCHVCVGNDCSRSAGQYCLKYTKNDFCFAKYDNGQVELMGCGSTLNQSDIDEWTEQNQLYRCSDNECNDLVRLPAASECIACDSSKTPDCAQDPTILDRYEACAGATTECLTYINGYDTVRGCANSLTQSQQDSCKRAGTCAICSGNKCNSEVYPADRRKCHICNSVRDANCKETPNSIAICPNYSSNDRCVARRVDELVERGCATDLTCDTNDEKKCQICDTDGCNTKAMNSSAIVSGSLMFTSILAYIVIRGIKIF